MKSIWKWLIAGAIIRQLCSGGMCHHAAAPPPAAATQAPAQPPKPRCRTQAPGRRHPPGGSPEAPVTLTFIKIADELESKAFAEILDEFHKIDGGKYANVNIEYNAKPFAELFPRSRTLY